MTADQLAAMHIDAAWLEPLVETFNRFDISTPERKAAFIGQCQHESANFKTLRENLNYSDKGLCATWPKRFPTMEAAAPYHRNPEKIANKVYCDRMGNGSEESGEGWKYSGRGLIQLTGKANYMAASDALMVDLVADPDLVLLPEYAALTAAWFWDKNGLNKYADVADYPGMTKRINGGTIGLVDRVKHITTALTILSA
jgi:putative chitinase